jgi:hypothetical protein
LNKKIEECERNSGLIDRVAHREFSSERLSEAVQVVNGALRDQESKRLTAEAVFNNAMSGNIVISSHLSSHCLTTCDNNHLDAVLVFSVPWLAFEAIVSATDLSHSWLSGTHLRLAYLNSASLAIL